MKILRYLCVSVLQFSFFLSSLYCFVFILLFVFIFILCIAQTSPVLFLLRVCMKIVRCLRAVNSFFILLTTISDRLCLMTWSVWIFKTQSSFMFHVSTALLAWCLYHEGTNNSQKVSSIPWLLLPVPFFAFALLYSLSYSSVPSFASLHFAFEITFYVVDFHFLTLIFSVSSWAANSVPSVYFFSSPLVCQSQPFSSLLSVSGIVHGIHWSVLFLCLLSLSFFYLFKCSFMFHHPFLLHYLN